MPDIPADDPRWLLAVLLSANAAKQVLSWLAQGRTGQIAWNVSQGRIVNLDIIPAKKHIENK